MSVSLAGKECCLGRCGDRVSGSTWAHGPSSEQAWESHGPSSRAFLLLVAVSPQGLFSAGLRGGWLFTVQGSPALMACSTPAPTPAESSTVPILQGQTPCHPAVASREAVKPLVVTPG